MVQNDIIPAAGAPAKPRHRPAAAETSPERICALNDRPAGAGPVICWLSRDQRAHDNWALLHAQALALDRRRPLHAAFCLTPSSTGATLRQHRFLLAGLAELAATLAAHNISFHLATGAPEEQLPALARKLDAGAVTCDFSPLRRPRAWRTAAAAALPCTLLEVDAHNIVPCRFASPRREYAAYTIRPKIEKQLEKFLTPFPPLAVHPFGRAADNWPGRAAAEKTLAADRTVAPVGDPVPGERAAAAAMQRFLREKLDRYAAGRNDPNADCQSGLSPYLHFGQLSPQRLALEVDRHGEEPAATVFLEELIVRRELAENFCFYCPDYDTVAGFPAWAAESHRRHAADPRPYLYDRAVLAGAATADPLWNAAQRQLLRTGRMHGYLRMYWAKQLLTWSATAAEALAHAIYLNDRYALDGRDPNGYAGIMWSLGGVHDRPWPRRPVFGTIRAMSSRGAAKRFDVGGYIARFPPG